MCRAPLVLAQDRSLWATSWNIPTRWSGWWHFVPWISVLRGIFLSTPLYLKVESYSERRGEIGPGPFQKLLSTGGDYYVSRSPRLQYLECIYGQRSSLPKPLLDHFPVLSTSRFRITPVRAGFHFVPSTPKRHSHTQKTLPRPFWIRKGSFARVLRVILVCDHAFIKKTGDFYIVYDSYLGQLVGTNIWYTSLRRKTIPINQRE